MSDDYEFNLNLKLSAQLSALLDLLADIAPSWLPSEIRARRRKLLKEHDEYFKHTALKAGKDE